MPVQEARSDEQARKARGAFFTPPQLADFLADWAVRTAHDRVLDPSCGEAALLLAAGRRLLALGGRPNLGGFDLHRPSIAAARKLLAANGMRGDLQAADFFTVDPTAGFDAIVGNPPYIRYQAFVGEDRRKAQRAALAQGVRLSGLANAWAAFVVHAAAFLKSGGRMALVLPAVLLSVNYAAPVRRFLLQRFSSIKLVMFEERVFPEVQEEVVLLFAEGAGPTPRFDVFQLKDLDGLAAILGMPAGESSTWTPTAAADKWTGALLPDAASRLFSSLTGGGQFTELGQWGDPDLGMVTGNNEFFTLTAAAASSLKLEDPELLRISPPGSRHLRGLTFDDAAFAALAAAGQRVYLFNPPADRPSKAALAYIRQGERTGVHLAYKCAVRTPWWSVPAVPVPDLFLTYMNQDAPRLVDNAARAAHLNSVHGVTLRRGLRELGRESLPLALLNSLTLLSAELVGRSYGGGILKLEPKEAERLALPAPALIQRVAPRLRALRSQASGDLRSSSLREIIDLVDRIVLLDTLGLRPSELATIRAAHQAMVARRSSRASAR